MKRIFIFLLLGPVIGYAVYVLWQLSLGRSVGGIENLLLGLPFAFIFAVLPSLVIGIADHWLAERTGQLPRILLTALIGYVASMAMMAVWTAVPIPLPHLLTFGVVGAIQGGVCSWLASVTHSAEVSSANRAAR